MHQPTPPTLSPIYFDNFLNGVGEWQAFLCRSRLSWPHSSQSSQGLPREVGKFSPAALGKYLGLYPFSL